MTLKVTDENYDTLIGQSELPVVLDFWAPRCGPCKMISPSIDALAEEYAGRVIIGKIDVDENPELPIKFGVRNIPTILYLKDGDVVNKHIGSTSKMFLEEKLSAIL